MITPTLRLLEWARGHGPDVLDTVSQAIVLAQQTHRGHYRLSGDPYISHCVEVALILVERDAAPEIVVTAVLHGVFKSPSAPSLDDIHSRFGDLVAHLLAEYSTLNYREYDLRWEHVDSRALQVKVADRVHNMRTIRHLSPEPQRSWAHNTQQLVAPLARSLGMDDLGRELDRLSAATLRSTDGMTPALPHSRTSTRSDLRTAVLHGVVRAGVLALPQHCRARWRQDWDGELYACSSVGERVVFVRNVVLGLPVMARETRRTARP